MANMHNTNIIMTLMIPNLHKYIYRTFRVVVHIHLNEPGNQKFSWINNNNHNDQERLSKTEKH